MVKFVLFENCFCNREMGVEVANVCGIVLNSQGEMELRLVGEGFDGRATVRSNPVLNHEIW